MRENHDIVESGRLERYLLGVLPNDERIEVEAALKKDPDLRAHVDQLEKDLETMAMENAVSPPNNVKQAVFRQLQMDTSNKVIKLKPVKPARNFTAIAASLAALFMLSSFWLYQKMNGIQADLKVVKEQNNLLLKEKENLEKGIEATNKWLVAVNDPETEKLIMKGNEILPEATAISYVNHTEKTVILNASGLPDLGEDKDYQLWADVDGEMIDMGVIPKNSDMVAMTYIADAESLNITIEPAGGSDHPTVSNLISFVSI
jgi:anti-sigma-K factor RskA